MVFLYKNCQCKLSHSVVWLIFILAPGYAGAGATASLDIGYSMVYDGAENIGWVRDANPFSSIAAGNTSRVMTFTAAHDGVIYDAVNSVDSNAGAYPQSPLSFKISKGDADWFGYFNPVDFGGRTDWRLPGNRQYSVSYGESEILGYDALDIRPRAVSFTNTPFGEIWLFACCMLGWFCLIGKR